MDKKASDEDSALHSTPSNPRRKSNLMRKLVTQLKEEQQTPLSIAKARIMISIFFDPKRYSIH